MLEYHAFHLFHFARLFTSICVYVNVKIDTVDFSLRYVSVIITRENVAVSVTPFVIWVWSHPGVLSFENISNLHSWKCTALSRSDTKAFQIFLVAHARFYFRLVPACCSTANSPLKPNGEQMSLALLKHWNIRNRRTIARVMKWSCYWIKFLSSPRLIFIKMFVTIQMYHCIFLYSLQIM